MGNLLDEISAAGQHPGNVCGVRRVRDQLDPADATDLDAAIADTTLTGAQIARALHARGLKVSGDMMNRHRKGECGCGRPG